MKPAQTRQHVGVSYHRSGMSSVHNTVNGEKDHTPDQPIWNGMKQSETLRTQPQSSWRNIEDFYQDLWILCAWTWISISCGMTPAGTIRLNLWQERKQNHRIVVKKKKLHIIYKEIQYILLLFHLFHVCTLCHGTFMCRLCLPWACMDSHEQLLQVATSMEPTCQARQNTPDKTRRQIAEDSN